MSYSIDYTAQVYAVRRAWKVVGVACLVGVLGGIGWGVQWTYKIYIQPTLAERLSEYHGYARNLEDFSATVTKLSGEYEKLMPYYRVQESQSVTNVMPMLATWQATAPAGVVPTSWKLQTGTNCVLNYTMSVNELAKTAQLEEARKWFSSLTNALGVAKVDVKDSIKNEDLAKLKEVSFTISFALKNKTLAVPKPAKALSDAEKKIAALRKRLNSVLLGKKNEKDKTLENLLQNELVANPGKPERKDYWNTACKKVISPELYWDERDREILVDEKSKTETRAPWKRISEARFPWSRYRELDNEALAQEVVWLGTLSKKVNHRSAFDVLEARLEELRYPLSRGFAYNDVFNEHVGERRVAELFRPFEAKVVFEHGKYADIEMPLPDEAKADAAEPKAESEVANTKKLKILLTPWVVVFSPGGEPLSLVGETVEAVAAAKWGLMVEKLEISFVDQRPDSVKVSGCFPVNKVEK